MAVPAGTGKSGRIEFRLSPNEASAGGFRIEVSDTAVTWEITTASADGLGYTGRRLGVPFSKES